MHSQPRSRASSPSVHTWNGNSFSCTDTEGTPSVHTFVQSRSRKPTSKVQKSILKGNKLRTQPSGVSSRFARSFATSCDQGTAPTGASRRRLTGKQTVFHDSDSLPQQVRSPSQAWHSPRVLSGHFEFCVPRTGREPWGPGLGSTPCCTKRLRAAVARSSSFLLLTFFKFRKKWVASWTLVPQCSHKILLSSLSKQFHQLAYLIGVPQGRSANSGYSVIYDTFCRCIWRWWQLAECQSKYSGWVGNGPSHGQRSGDPVGLHSVDGGFQISSLLTSSQRSFATGSCFRRLAAACNLAFCDLSMRRLWASL